jgi:hypothetical protein
MILIGLALPGFIFYSIFFAGPSTPGMSEAVEITEQFDHLAGGDFRVLSVHSAGPTVQARIVLEPSATDNGDMHLRGLNAQYDFQAVLGRGQDLGVVVGETDEAGVFRPLGVIFYSAATEQSHFRRVAAGLSE